MSEGTRKLGGRLDDYLISGYLGQDERGSALLPWLMRARSNNNWRVKMSVSVTGTAWAYRAMVLGGLALLLVGCGKGGENQGTASKGQVVARVGDDVITIPELETEFRAANIPADKQKQPEIVKRMLGDLVLRKYLVQQALAAKLDREPSVLLDILRAREQVLATAMISRNIAAKASSITQAEVSKYIESNPQKFANRQLIEVDQIAFPTRAKHSNGD